MPSKKTRQENDATGTLRSPRLDQPSIILIKGASIIVITSPSDSPKSKKTFIGSHGIATAKHVGCLEHNKQLDVYLSLTDQPARTIGQGTKVLGFDFGPHAGLLATVDSAANVTVLSSPDGQKFEIPTGQRQSSPQNKRDILIEHTCNPCVWMRRQQAQLPLAEGHGPRSPCSICLSHAILSSLFSVAQVHRSIQTPTSGCVLSTQQGAVQPIHQP